MHDLDYLTWLLDDAPVALRAHASTGDDPATVARACGMWEYSEVHPSYLAPTVPVPCPAAATSTIAHPLPP